MMKRAVRVVKAQGWSFLKSGFGGEKQVRWLKDHGLLRHEALIYGFNPLEGPPPREESPLQEDCVILDKAKYKVVAPLVDDLSKLYFAWSRFEKTLPVARTRWDEEREIKKDRFDWRFAEAARVKRVLKSRRLGFGVPKGSAFPLPVVDRIFYSHKSLLSFVGKRLKEKKEEKEIIASQRMLDMLSGGCDRTIGVRSIRIHPAVVCAASKKIFLFFKRGLVCS